MENNEKELLERLAALEEQEKKHGRRVFVITAVTMVLMLGLVVFMWINVSAFMSEMRPVADVVESLDTEAVAAKVNELAAMDTTGLAKLADHFAAMDEDELAARMDGMQDALELFSRLDVESLSEALENLSKTLEPLMKLFGGR